MANSVSFTIPTTGIITWTDENWTLQPLLCREPRPGELLIKIFATGICHTDIANVGGIYPRILGHEGAGKILKIGPECHSLHADAAEVGDPVILSFAYCRNCHMCVKGHPAFCKDQVPLNIRAEARNLALAEEDDEDERLEVDDEGRRRVVKAGYFGHSSFCGIALVKESSVVLVKGLVKDEEELRMFAPLGCGIQTGACAVLNVIKPAPDDSVGVFGLGGVGLSAIMAAKAINLKTIIAVDILENRLALAIELGATHTINSKNMSKEELALTIRSLSPFTEGKAPPFGPTGIVDTTGHPFMIQTALATVDRMGRVVQLANHGPGTFVSVSLPEHMRDGVHLTGTIQGDADPKKSIPLLIQWYREGKFPLEKLEKMFRVHEFKKAKEEMRSGVTIKPVLIWP